MKLRLKSILKKWAIKKIFYEAREIEKKKNRATGIKRL